MASTKNIIEGMQILLPKYKNPDGYHTAAEHDVFYMYETDTPLTDEEQARMEELGWRRSDSDGWEIFT